MRCFKWIVCGFVALGLTWSTAGCRASRQSEVQSKVVASTRIDTADSLMRLITASVDSPEIIVVRLDSPRTYIKMRARSVSTATSTISTSHSATTGEIQSSTVVAERQTTSSTSSFHLWSLLVMAIAVASILIAVRKL